MVIAFALYNTENDAYFVLYDTLFMGWFLNVIFCFHKYDAEKRKKSAPCGAPVSKLNSVVYG